MSRATPYQLDLAAGFGTWEWNLTTDESTWSDELFAILGVSPDSTVPGQAGFTSAMHPDDVARVAVALDRVRRDGARAELEIRIRAPDTTVRFARLRAWRTADARRLVALVEDVNRSTPISDQVSSVSAFAAGIAHEINNPLSFLSANLEMIGEELEPVQTPREVDVLLREARHGLQRIHTIVRGLMTFSRVEPTHYEQIDVNRLIEVAIGITHMEIRQRARLVRNFRPVPPVNANAARLGQVLVNLLLNAAQAIPQGDQAEHEISVSTLVDASGHVVIEVRDTGRGIPKSLGNRVFEALVTTKPPGSGSGLGLSVCRNIVHAIGGEITFESEPGNTVFRVHLPPSIAESPKLPSAPIAARRGSVMIVDDDTMFANSLGRLLSREHDVAISRDGNEAYERLRAGERFDVIVCDLMMPGMGGIDLYGKVFQLAAAQAERMIFLTARTPEGLTFLTGITNPYFEKPCNIDSLRATIRRLVG